MITKQDIVKGLQELGIESGDNVFVTSSLSRFGKVDGGAKTVVDAILEVVGSGTVVMPSFNFSIFKEKEIVLDLNKTPSQMGVITEYFRKLEGVLRTTNLFHPLCYKGSLGSELSKCDMTDTWGEKSPYAFMVEKDFKLVLLGTDFYSCPFFHFAEQKHNVPYREPIDYVGFVEGTVKGAPFKDRQKCRRLKRKSGDSDNNRFYDKIPVNEGKIGNSMCRSIGLSTLMFYIDSKLDIDPDYLFTESDLLSPMPTMDTFDMLEAVNVLFAEKRDLVSQGFKNSLDYISTFLPLKYHSWKTGEQIETWTIPSGDIDSLYVGEFTIKGFKKDEIIIPIHLDHAGMANDNLSGVVVATELALRLLRTSDLNYTYRFLFVPETIGTMAYMSRFNPKPLFGIVIDSVGTKDNLVVTKTKFNSLVNRYIESPTNEFLSDAHLWSGNDERVLECWGIPAIQFSRLPFRQYHTFQDNPSIIVKSKLEETLEEVYDFILRVERDFIPKPTYKGVPCLSKVGLWELDLGIEKTYHLIGYGLTIADIAKKIDMPFKYVYDFVIKMELAGLVRR